MSHYGIGVGNRFFKFGNPNRPEGIMRFTFGSTRGFVRGVLSLAFVFICFTAVSGCRLSDACNNGQKDGDETGIDCGGSCSAQCKVGVTSKSSCTANSDCESNICRNNTCFAASCGDGIKNGSESDVDCGGEYCPACDNGKTCANGAGTNCKSGICVDKICLECTVDSDCSPATTGGKCVLSGCTKKPEPAKTDAGTADGSTMDGGSSDDGGSIGVKPDQGGTVTATCSDSIKNGNESDVDCGGSCPTKCVDTKACVGGVDCQSGVCSNAVCQKPTCVDGVKNDGETDTDCGGNCSACGDGKACVLAKDCQSGVCGSGMCQSKMAPATCMDGVKNQNESDVDCGGVCGAKCVIGKICGGNGDCASGNCSNGTCAVPVMVVGQRIVVTPTADYLATCKGSVLIYAWDPKGTPVPKLGEGKGTFDVTNLVAWSGVLQFGFVCNGQWDLSFDMMMVGLDLSKIVTAVVTGQSKSMTNQPWQGGAGNRPSLFLP